MWYQVKWAQPDGGCGEAECSQFFADREEAFHFSYSLDPQTCKGIRVLEQGGLVGHWSPQTHVATVSGEPYTRQVSKLRQADRQYVAIALAADKLANGRQAYRVVVVGEPGKTRLQVAALMYATHPGTPFTMHTLATVKRSYKRAWREWEETQRADQEAQAYGYKNMEDYNEAAYHDLTNR